MSILFVKNSLLLVEVKKSNFACGKNNKIDDNPKLNVFNFMSMFDTFFEKNVRWDTFVLFGDEHKKFL